MDDKFKALADKAIVELGYTDTFVVEIKANNNKVEIFLDSDESVTFEKCRKISRLMEETLDDEKWLGEKYTLDVSSAGVGRPLRFNRQYVKNIGRTIEVKTKDAEKIKGTLAQANGDDFGVEITKTVKKGKKKTKVTELIMVNYEDVKEAKIKVTF